MDKTEKYNDLIEKLKLIAKQDENIRCCFIFGSRAHNTNYADKWSDLDIAIICNDPSAYIEKQDWLKSFGDAIFAFKEAVSLGVGMQIRVLFEDFQDVDFGFFSQSDFQKLLKDNRFYHGTIGRGVKILIDKDGHLDFIKGETFLKNYFTPEVKQSSFENNVDDFLYHAVSAVKKLHKNEILTAKDTLDSTMKTILILFVRWYVLSKDSSADTWHRNRHFEKWADLKFVNRLGNLYSIYNKYDIYEKIIVNIRNFEKLVREVAQMNNLTYPYEKFKIVLDWITENEPE